MDYTSKKRLTQSPSAKEKFYSIVYQKFEKNTLPMPEVDLENDITFFGNQPACGVKLGYDQFFSFAKVFPLFDKRKDRENRGFPADIWRNINQQERPPKPVPATSSQWYGRRPGYDPEICKYGRQNLVASFYSTRGVFHPEESEGIRI